MLVAITPLGRFLEVLDYAESFSKKQKIKLNMRGYPFA
jgi:hypothetical protein